MKRHAKVQKAAVERAVGAKQLRARLLAQPRRPSPARETRARVLAESAAKRKLG